MPLYRFTSLRTNSARQDLKVNFYPLFFQSTLCSIRTYTSIVYLCISKMKVNICVLFYIRHVTLQRLNNDFLCEFKSDRQYVSVNPPESIQQTDTKTKWSPFRRRIFCTHFRKWKLLYFDSNLIEVCSQGSNWQCVLIGSDNGLEPNRRQAIIWSNAFLVCWRIYASLVLDELTKSYHDVYALIWADGYVSILSPP